MKPRKMSTENTYMALKITLQNQGVHALFISLICRFLMQLLSHILSSRTLIRRVV